MDTVKPVVLQLCSLSPHVADTLRDEFQVLDGWEATQRARLTDQDLSTVTGIVTGAPIGVSPELFARLPELKVVSCRGVGMDRIDLSYAKAHGIQVSGTFGTLAGCVADMALGLLVDVARRIRQADRFVRQGSWETMGFPLATRVHHKRIGIVGLGEIGSLVAQRAQGFSMDIRYTGRQPKHGVPYPFEPSLEALARWCDFLVVTVSGGAQTQHMVSALVLEALGADGILVNVSRGSVVDTSALVQALLNGRLAGAGLDVFEDEPHVPEALRDLEQVVLTPHIASATYETRTAMEDLALRNLQAFYTKGQVLTPAF